MDITAPSSYVSYPAQGGKLKSVAVISGGAVDPTPGSGLSQVRVSIRKISDTTFWTGSGWTSDEQFLPASGPNPWSFTSVPNWTSGEYYIVRSKAYDIATNDETPGAGNTFIFDKVTPTSYVAYPSNGAILSGAGIITGIANDSYTGISNVEINIKRLSDATYWNGSAYQTSESGSWLNATGAPVWAPWTAGGADWTTNVQFNIRSRATDGASNVETPTNGITFTCDNAAPSSEVIYPTNNAKISSWTVISGTSGDATSSVNNVKISIKNTGSTTYFTGAGGWTASEVFFDVTSGTTSWFYNVPFGPVSGTTYIIRSKGTDVANNTETPTAGISFRFDNALPSSIILFPSNSTTIKALLIFQEQHLMLLPVLSAMFS